jgi:hypothetical protein
VAVILGGLIPEEMYMDIINLVELVADDDESAFNQPCKHGNLMFGHAVYCHNSKWADAPRKCRRTWYTGGEVRDEDCEGFAHNDQSGMDAA